jgi:hypothetical protein
MQVISNTLKPIIETWDDPGDYPNGLAQGPLPSRKSLAGCEGAIVVELELSDIDQLINEQIETETNPTLTNIRWHVPEIAIVAGKIRLALEVDTCDTDDNLDARDEDC